MNSQFPAARLETLRMALKAKYPEVHNFLFIFYFDRLIEPKFISAEVAIKLPEEAKKIALNLRKLLEKKDVPWESIDAAANFAQDSVSDADKTWAWLEEIIDVLEGNVSQEARDFWEKNKNTRPLLGQLL